MQLLTALHNSLLRFHHPHKRFRERVARTGGEKGHNAVEDGLAVYLWTMICQFLFLTAPLHMQAYVWERGRDGGEKSEGKKILCAVRVQRRKQAGFALALQ
jgi:hypothetical protein